MSSQFEAEKNRKAFLYTGIICVLLVLAALISWKVPGIPPPIAEELIEINLGNFDEGLGDVQPLIKGDKAPDQESADRQMTTNDTPAKDAVQDDNEEEDAAPVTKVEKPITKTNTVKPRQQTVITKPTAVVTAKPRPQKPKIAGYNGPKNGTGNGATEKDNGYKYQGNNPIGGGDAGAPNGHPDSYGKSLGGKVGGLRVSKGDRTIINNYIFSGDLEKATINAIIRVSPDGKGTYVGRDKGSTSTDAKYTNAIIRYLLNIKFSKADHESIVTVPFNFTVSN